MNAKHAAIAVAVLILAAGGFWIAKNNLRSFQPEGDRVFAVFDGGEIKGKDVLGLIELDPATDAETIQKVKISATIQKVKQRLLEIEAAKQNTTPNELMNKMTSDIAPVTDEDIAQQLGKDPKSASKAEIKDARNRAQRRKAEAAGSQYLNELYKRAGARIYIEK